MGRFLKATSKSEVYMQSISTKGAIAKWIIKKRLFAKKKI